MLKLALRLASNYPLWMKVHKIKFSRTNKTLLVSDRIMKAEDKHRSKSMTSAKKKSRIKTPRPIETSHYAV